MLPGVVSTNTFREHGSTHAVGVSNTSLGCVLGRMVTSCLGAWQSTWVQLVAWDEYSTGARRYVRKVIRFLFSRKRVFSTRAGLEQETISKLVKKFLKNIPAVPAVPASPHAKARRKLLEVCFGCTLSVGCGNFLPVRGSSILGKCSGLISRR